MKSIAINCKKRRRKVMRRELTFKWGALQHRQHFHAISSAFTRPLLKTKHWLSWSALVIMEGTSYFWERTVGVSALLQRAVTLAQQEWTALIRKLTYAMCSRILPTSRSIRLLISCRRISLIVWCKKQHDSDFALNSKSQWRCWRGAYDLPTEASKLSYQQ